MFVVLRILSFELPVVVALIDQSARHANFWAVDRSALMVSAQAIPQIATFPRILADRQATGGGNLQYCHPMAAKARLLIRFELERDFRRTGIASSIEKLTAA